jgi:hypothetical protein
MHEPTEINGNIHYAALPLRSGRVTAYSSPTVIQITVGEE